MKAVDLQISETKKVIIATYAMAEEALDIKTLSTLLMATPKTDVRQAVGRILRQKHKEALVIDIVDSHGLFQRQWIKRKRYYKKANYKIVGIGSGDYQTKIWETIYEPKSKKNESKSMAERVNQSNIGLGKCLIMDDDDDDV